MKAKYQTFSTATYQQRIGRARQVLLDTGASACLMVAPEHQYYFSGFDSWTAANNPQALIFTAWDDEPTLLLRNVDLSLAQESTCLRDIRTYKLHSENFPQRVREILLEKGIQSGKLATEFQSFALPFYFGQELAEALSPMELTDATELLGSLRLIKSKEEISQLEQAGRFASLGLQAMQTCLKPGMSEIELAGNIESAMRSAGCDYWAIPIELTSGNRSAGCHGTPRSKTIESGDLVHVEFAGVSHRYHATAIQTLALGTATSHQTDIYQIGLVSLQAGINAIKPGIPVAEVEQASLEPLAKHNLEHSAMMRFGYGIGIAYPPIWLETLQISKDFDTRMEPGMVFVLHSCLEFPDQELGVILGGTYVLEDSGIRQLCGAGAVELKII